MQIKKLASLPLILMLTGCATTNKLSDEQARVIKGIRTVSVSTQVGLPEKPSVYGKKSAAGALLGGGIGIALVQGMSDEADEFKTFLEKNKIDVGNIVRSEVINFLEETKRSTSASEGLTIPKIELVVEHYGLSPTISMSLSLLNKPLKPGMRVAVRLTSVDGIVVWEGKDFLTALGNPSEPHTLDEYYSNPQMLEEAFRQTARILIRGLLKDFASA